MTAFDTSAESRAWSAARNVPDDVMTEHEFLHGTSALWNGPVGSNGRPLPTQSASVSNIPGFREHTEAAVARIARNSIVHMDSREQAMGDLEEALHHLFDDDDPRDLSLKLPAVRRAWTAWKDTL